ncbi:hypothetical protein T265_02065 [Opisthorchis viverrini]|uniref:Uncharacterized protein n=1 Tax=Opisthorchis viverrini TaxID=6198 RepID=A0A074ZX94_OPIVI|nr:hypothetical protein T265_02065 [Opisthorchis viverrini]KER31691.1 hypothetical protein T265_02065 [Opisthorchis viverrini]
MSSGFMVASVNLPLVRFVSNGFKRAIRLVTLHELSHDAVNQRQSLTSRTNPCCLTDHFLLLLNAPLLILPDLTVHCIRGNQALESRLLMSSWLYGEGVLHSK